MKIQNLIALALLALTSLLPIGCQRTLAPDGVYQGDRTLYEVDNVIATSHDLMQEFITWESNHRAFLAQYPEIRKLADKIFTEGPAAYASALAIRDLYAEDPTKENRSKLDLAIEVLRSLTREATKWLANPATNPVP